MTTWNERKRRLNLAKHRVDLALAEHFDWERAIIEEDASERYGEQRQRATGLIARRSTFTFTRCAATRITLSASVPRRSGRSASMSKKFEPLTPEELAEIARRRAEARRMVQEELENMSDEEDARLTAAAENDPDNPPLTDEDWRRMRPAHEVLPELVARHLRRNRGRPKLAAPKQQVTLRIDPDVLEHFRAMGAGWQTAINDALRKSMANGGKRD